MTKNTNLDEIKITMFDSANARRHKDGTPMATKDETGQLWLPVSTVIENPIENEMFYIRWGKYHQTVIDWFVIKAKRRVQDDVKTSDHGDTIGRLAAVRKKFEEYETGNPLEKAARVAKVAIVDPVDNEIFGIAKAYIEKHILSDCRNIQERAASEANEGWYTLNAKGGATENKFNILAWAKHEDQTALEFEIQAKRNLAYAEKKKEAIADKVAKLVEDSKVDSKEDGEK